MRKGSIFGHRRSLDVAVRVTGEAARIARVDGIVRGPGPAAEAGGLVIAEGLLDFVAGVHHEWSVLGNRFADGTALQQQQLGFIGTVLKRDARRIEFYGGMALQKLVVDAERTSTEKV